MDMLSFLMGKACGGTGGGSSITVEALTATENKTYTAPEGKAYSPATVNVPSSGVTNIKTGTFKPSTTGVGTLDTGYTGNGYPIAAVFIVDGGLSNPTNTDWYDAVANGAVGMWSMTKSNMTSAPTYNGTYQTTDGCSVTTLRKSSASDAQTYSGGGGTLTATFNANSAPVSAGNTCIKFSDKKTVNYYASSAGGLKTGITYRYWVVYSE